MRRQISNYFFNSLLDRRFRSPLSNLAGFEHPFPGAIEAACGELMMPLGYSPL